MFLQKGLTQPRCEELITAIQASKVKKAQNLIERMNQIELSKIDSEGKTALTYAASKGLEKVCEKLIPKMTDQAINHVNYNGYTALTAAAWKGLEKVCELLIPKMTDQAINSIIKDFFYNGNTALTYAASKGLEKVCKLLIPKMTDQAINHVNKDGDTALSLAQQKGLKNICDLLNLKTNEQNNQNKLTEKINIFQELVNKVNTNIANNATINSKDKSIMEETIKGITDKIKVLHNTTAIEKITTNMQKLIVDKPTKLQLVTIEDQMDKLLESQNINDDVTILGDSTI